MKKLKNISGFLSFLMPLFSSSVPLLQTWTSASSLVSVSMAAVSIWRAVINVPVTTDTGSHRMAKAVKVCRGLCWAVGWSWQLVVQQHDWVMSAFYVSLLDVNECALSNTCFGGMCINTPGSYICENCKLGFGPSADGLRCEGLVDVNQV